MVELVIRLLYLATYAVNLASMQSGIKEPQQFEYGTARFKLEKHSRVPYTRHYTSLKIFVTCLRALGKVMTSPPLVASNHTCYKLVTSLSTRARNVNALDTCHMRNQLERVFPL